uniref:non-specific serine/threonine protein kinase n=1 Tax=Parascaris equorum TaxID=6256 RepID=A0A914RXL1_PAREQ
MRIAPFNSLFYLWCRVCGVFFCEMGSKNETSSATNGATPESIAFPAYGLIGNGGYGEIYYAIDMTNGEPVAAKVEPVKRRGKVVRRMILEQKVKLTCHLCGAQGSSERSTILSCKTFAPLLKIAGHDRFLNKLAIAGLRDLHNFGYLHRDIKPANMCFGLTKKSMRRLFIVDYGLVRRFRRDDGQRVPQRAHVGFRGTMRYVSMRVHDRKEQGPSDDMIALFFCLMNECFSMSNSSGKTRQLE